MFAIRFYCGKLIVFVLRNTLALCFHDLKFLIVNPDTTGKEPLRRLIEFGQNLGGYIKDVEAEFVNFFFPDVTKVVLVDLAWFKREWVDTSQIVNVCLGYSGIVDIGKKLIFSYRSPLSSNVKVDTR